MRNITNKRAQVAVEYMLIAAFLLIATGIIFIYSMTTLDQTIRIAKADKAISILASAADNVSARGPGNTIITEIELPTEVASYQILFSGKTISLSINTPNGQNERFVETSSDLNSATLSLSSGKNIIKVEMVNDKVVFSEG